MGNVPCSCNLIRRINSSVMCSCFASVNNLSNRFLCCKRIGNSKKKISGKVGNCCTVRNWLYSSVFFVVVVCRVVSDFSASNMYVSMYSNN